MSGEAAEAGEALEAADPPVLHPALPDVPRSARLPGTGPVGPDEWIVRDEAFARQMALRDRLAGLPGTLAMLPGSEEAAGELLGLVLDRLARDPDYRAEGRGAAGTRGGAARPGPSSLRGAIPFPDGTPSAPARGGVPTRVARPDGVVVPVDPGRPMATLARLVQEDLCVLQPGPDGHVLTAGALLFPSFWRLPEKLGRSLVSIHGPVDEYGPDLAARVQRLFDAIRPGRPLCRWNWLHYDEPWLHQPRDEAIRRSAGPGAPWLRRERQCLLRLPRTRAVVFTIHTYVVPAPAAAPGRRVRRPSRSP